MQTTEKAYQTHFWNRSPVSDNLAMNSFTRFDSGLRVAVYIDRLQDFVLPISSQVFSTDSSCKHNAWIIWLVCPASPISYPIIPNP